MINNRQGGRRRGRGGQRPQNLGGRPDGNRQDNRQRGNAAQLLEKYKSMARDAQLSGDRVQSEYWLQFADHYFRVLDESRSRFDEQRKQRGDDSDDDESENETAEAGGDRDQDNREEERGRRRDRPAPAPAATRTDRPRRSARADRPAEDSDKRSDAERSNGDGERIAPELLPPAIGRDDSGSAGDGAQPDEDSPRPRRRARRPRPDSEGDVAPAA